MYSRLVADTKHVFMDIVAEASVQLRHKSSAVVMANSSLWAPKGFYGPTFVRRELILIDNPRLTGTGKCQLAILRSITKFGEREY